MYVPSISSALRLQTDATGGGGGAAAAWGCSLGGSLGGSFGAAAAAPFEAGAVFPAFDIFQVRKFRMIAEKLVKLQN